ncbi:MAG: DegV family protein, partial [Erysipelotrichaceae bacterium]|nr:DegV family protein [Erysipelotrichaceae bacterium]
MCKVAFLCDSAADISKQEAEQLGIHVVRMPLIINGKEYIEEESIGEGQWMKALKNGEKIHTSQPSVGELKRIWDELLKNYDEILYLPISKELSGTYNNAMLLAKEYEGKVIVIESRFVCYPIIKMLQVAKEMLKAGYHCLEIKKKLEEEGEMFAILIPENLQTLKNGGRISPAAAALGGLLKIHPLLKVEHGAIDVEGKVRTIKKAYQEGVQRVIQGIDPNDYDWMIIDADNREMSDSLKKELEAILHLPVEQRSFKAIIMSHTGPGTIGFG